MRDYTRITTSYKHSFVRIKRYIDKNIDNSRESLEPNAQCTLTANPTSIFFFLIYKIFHHRIVYCTKILIILSMAPISGFSKLPQILIL